MSVRSRSLIAAALMAGIAASGLHNPDSVRAPVVISGAGAPPKPKPKKTSKPTHRGPGLGRFFGRQSPFPIHRDEAKKKSQYKPHQGARECARRRGDWPMVSVIDAAKKYPYGINHRMASMLRPDRVEVEFAAPEPGRIQLLR